MNLIYPFGTFGRRLASSSSSRLPASSWESPAKLPGGFSMLGFCFFAGAPCPLALGLDREKEDKETCGFLPCSLTACCSSQVLAGFFFRARKLLGSCSGQAGVRCCFQIALACGSSGRDGSAARGMQAGARGLVGCHWAPTQTKVLPCCRGRPAALLEVRPRINSARLGTRRVRAAGGSPKAPLLILLGSEGCCC